MRRAKHLAEAIGLKPVLSRARDRSYPVGAGGSLLATMAVGRLPSASVRAALYRLMGLRVGRETHIYGGLEIRAPGRITIGDGSVVGLNAILDGREGITIGRNVNLSSEVAIWTLQHDPQAADFGTKGGPVVIEDRAWLSFRCTVLPGVTIGEGAVVAAGSIVTKDVAPFTIVAGIPAERIGERTATSPTSWAEPRPTGSSSKTRPGGDDREERLDSAGGGTRTPDTRIMIPLL